MRQPKWDKYEAALLIETYWDIVYGKKSRNEAVSTLSKVLRNRVPSNEIDDTYRNENGINMRLGEIDCLFNEGKGGLMNTSELFREMVAMYKTDSDAYEKILKEARDMNSTNENKSLFKAWLATKYPKAVFDVVCSHLKTAEDFCIKVKVIRGPLLEIVEPDVLRKVSRTVTENKIFRIVNKKQHQNIVMAVNWYISFVFDPNTKKAIKSENSIADQDSSIFSSQPSAESNTKQDSAANINSEENNPKSLNNSDTAEVTDDRFESQFGLWLSNSEHMAPGTCRSYVSAIHGAENFAVEHGYEQTSIANADPAASMSVVARLVSDPQFLEFNQIQHNRFSAAFQKLAKFYEQTKPGCVIDIPEMSTRKKSVSEETPRIEVSSRLRDEINEFLKAATEGVTKTDLLTHFGQCNTRQINAGLEECHAVLVLKKYYSKDNISDYDEMADILLEILLKQFSANEGYTSAQQLYNEAHVRLDDFFFYNGAFDSRPEVFDLAAHLFGQEHYKGYTFIFNNGTHIWKEEPDYPKEYHGLLIKYAREHHNVFSREEAAEYFEWIGSSTPQQTLSNVFANTGSKSFLQYAENQFVLTEAVGINDSFLDGVGSQINLLLEGDDYIAFGEIDDYFYTTLPGLPTNIGWSPLLLADIIRNYDIGYTIMEAGNDNDWKTIPAAIVKTNSPFRTFGDIVWNEIQKDFSLPKEFSSGDFRDYLLSKGFIHGSEKMWNVHKTVADDIRFYWTDKNGKVTIN